MKSSREQLRIADLRSASPMSRRAFLAAASGLLLGGCASRRPRPTLNFYNWPKYIAPDTLSGFAARFDADVTYDNYAAQDTLEAKLRIGCFGYDLVVASDYKVTHFAKLGILAPLEQQRLPRLGNLFDWLREAPFDRGNRYSVPWQWGTTGIGYNTRELGDPVTSWRALWDPRFAGRITMLNERRETIAAALRLLGCSINTTSEVELARARDLLLEQKRLLKHYASDTYIDELASEDSVLAQGWSGDVFQAMDDNKAVSYAIPSEGSIVWVDSLVIPASAPHKELAHSFIDYMLDPKVSADLSNAISFATPNRAALPLVREADRSNPLIYPPAAVRDALEFVQDLGPAEALWNRTWEQVKLGVSA